MAKILFTSFYQDRNPIRQKELELCMVMNIREKQIEKIYVFLEGNRVDFPILNNEKITIIESERPTYRMFFNKANEVSSDNDIVIIANTDIFFDDSLMYIDRINMNNKCLALSRYHYQANGNMILHHEKFSQDVWIFKGKIRPINYCDFHMGVRGCLSGDTIVEYNRGKRLSTRPIKLKDFYKKFKGIGCGKKFDLNIETFSLSLNIDGRIFKNKVIDIIESGIKKTIKITFDDKTNIICTPDHPISVSNTEYMEAGKFKVGDFVVSKGDMRSIKTGRYKKRTWVYVKYHPHGHKMKLKGFEYNRKTRHRLVVEAELNGVSYEEFVNILNTNSDLSKSYKYLKSDEEVHHKDENTLNDCIDNLEVLTTSEHAKLHGIERRFNRNYTSKKRIFSIEEGAEIMTYDMQMEFPSHNFVANGIVVHNCDNRIAYEINNVGYIMQNPSKTIRSIHYHISESRNYDDRAIAKPYLSVEVTELS